MPKGHKQTALKFEPRSLFWVTEEGGELSRAVKEQLKERGYRVRLVKATQVERLKAPEELAGLIVIAPKAAKISRMERFVIDSFKLLKLCSKGLTCKEEAASLFITVSRNGGEFGLNGLSKKESCYSGGLAGLSKTASHEWPKVHCKAIDLASHFLSEEMAADSLLQECFLSGLLEVGITAEGCVMPSLSQLPLGEKDLSGEKPLSPGDLMVVTGGGRGVTKEVCLLAAKSLGLRLLILGRSPLPQEEPDWLVPLESEKEIKKALFLHEKGLKPKDIEASYLNIIKQRELRDSLASFSQAGVLFDYVALDVRDKASVSRAVKKAVKSYGPVRGILHGAGVLADKLIVDKTIEQFELVYSTKIASLQNLMEAVDLEQLKVLALFSSSTGRYGRRGQVDYAVANEILNKMAQYYRAQLPHCRSVAFGWGPWDGGMVDPSLKAIFEKEGVSCIPLSSGAACFLQEICQPPELSCEVVVLAKFKGQEALMAAGTLEADSLDATLSQAVSIESMPVLTDHVINGKAVLPAALVMEWLAEAAMALYPDKRLKRIESFQVVSGVRLSALDSITLSYESGDEKKAVMGDVSLSFQVSSTSAKTKRKTIHYRGAVVLCDELKSDKPSLLADPDLYQKGADEVYRELLFHGDALKGIIKIEGLSSLGISGRVSSAPMPAKWLQSPWRSEWVLDPLILDSAFQMMVLWSQEHWGAPSLPLSFKSYEQFVEVFPKEPCEVRVSILRDQNPRVLSDIEILGADGTLLARVSGYEGIGGESLKNSFKDNKIGSLKEGSSSRVL